MEFIDEKEGEILSPGEYNDEDWFQSCVGQDVWTARDVLWASGLMELVEESSNSEVLLGPVLNVMLLSEKSRKSSIKIDDDLNRLSQN